MADRESKTITLTPDEAAFVAACVASGRFRSETEVVRAALRLLEEQQFERDAELDRVRTLIQHGAEQLDRGEVIAADEVFRRLDEKHARLRD